MQMRRSRPHDAGPAVPPALEFPQQAVASFINMVQAQLVPVERSSSKLSTERTENKPHEAPEVNTPPEDVDHEGRIRIRKHRDTKPVRYQKAIFATLLPEYSLTEQDTIKSAFNPTSFTSISKLPHKLRPDAVRHSKPKQIRRNLGSEPHFHTQARALKSSGLFTDFQYTPSLYDRIIDKKRQEKHEQVQKFQMLCRDRFQGPGAGFRLKYEDPCDPNFCYPRLDDPFGEEEAQRKRDKLLNNSRIVGGPFRPTGRKLSEIDSHNAQALSRKSILDMIKGFHAALVADWPDQDFTVAATQDDFLAITFRLDTVDSYPALLSYMDVMMLRHPLCQKYLLAKVKRGWATCRVQEGYVWFILRPAWLKTTAFPEVLRQSAQRAADAAAHGGETRKVKIGGMAENRSHDTEDAVIITRKTSSLALKAEPLDGDEEACGPAAF